MFIVKKEIKGKDYYYLRESKREDGKVKAKTLAYLGKTKEEAEEKAKEFKLKSKKSNMEETIKSKEITIDELANELELNKSHAIVVSLERIFDQLDHNINPRLAVEVFMLDLPYIEH